MIIVAALGNPGPEYELTRHNIGFMLMDKYSGDIGLKVDKKGFDSLWNVKSIGGEEVFFLKPQTYMNLSGQAVKSLIGSKGRPDKLIVLYDDIDMPFGRLKIKDGGKSGGHNGIKSVTEHYGTPDYIRVKLGVGRPLHGTVSDYVLRAFSKDEQKELGKFLDYSVKALDVLIKDGMTQAMNDFN